jgi:trigger factor
MLEREIKKLPHSIVEIKVRVLWKDWQPRIAESAEELSKDLKIPGFRPGKAPLAMIEQKLGKDAILHRAGEKTIEKTYQTILSEEKIDAIGSPQAEIKKLAEGNDLEYLISTAVVPEVVLGDWKDAIKKINKEHAGSKIIVTGEEVDKEIKKIANSRAKLVTVNRPAQKEDSVLIDFQVKRAGVPIENGTSKGHPLVLGSGVFIPGFEDNLIGMSAGEEKDFELTFPKEYHEKSLAGKPTSFWVKMNLVQERELPELSDDFAKSLGKFADLDALKKSVEEGMQAERQKEAKDKRRTEVIEALIAKSEIDLPELLVHQEIHRMIEEFKLQLQSMGMGLEAYLEKVKKTEAELEKDWQVQAEKRVKASLVLEHLAGDQEIVVSGEKIEEEMNKTLKFYRKMGNVEKDLDTQRLYAHTKGVLQNEAVFEYLEKVQ